MNEMEKRLNLIEIEPLVDVRVIKESLSRIGIANKRKKILYPSCYLYETFGSFYIVHFKELFLLTRNDAYSNLCVDDIERKNSIVYCLKQWELIDVNEEVLEPHNKFVFVLPYEEKKSWNIQHKFNINSVVTPG